MYHSPLLHSKYLINGSCACYVGEKKERKHGHLSTSAFGTKRIPQKIEDEPSQK